MALNANALVTLAQGKTYLKIPALDLTQDSMVEFFINASSDYIESETDRMLKSQSHTEYHDGKKSNILVLREFPVTAIASVKLDNTGKFSGSETLVDPENYTIGDEGNSLYYRGYLPSGYRNIQVIYTAGLTTIPADLQNACLWAMTYYYQMRENRDIGRSAKGKGDESVSILQEMPPEVKNIVARYTRLEVANSAHMGRYG
jgi:uncharacterized phiE125 gp8 family phage protein